MNKCGVSSEGPDGDSGNPALRGVWGEDELVHKSYVQPIHEKAQDLAEND